MLYSICNFCVNAAAAVKIVIFFFMYYVFIIKGVIDVLRFLFVYAIVKSPRAVLFNQQLDENNHN